MIYQFCTYYYEDYCRKDGDSYEKGFLRGNRIVKGRINYRNIGDLYENEKVAIASITIGTMLTMAACSPSADKETEKKEQVTAQNEGEVKTTSTDETSKQRKILTKNKYSSNEKQIKMQKHERIIRNRK